MMIFFHSSEEEIFKMQTNTSSTIWYSIRVRSYTIHIWDIKTHILIEFKHVCNDVTLWKSH